MSYRKIEVDGVEYEYVIGKSNIHIRGFGDFSVKQHGNPVVNPNRPDDQVGFDTGRRIATPATVAALIKGQETPVNVAKREKRLMVNPYDAEISGKTNYLPYDAEIYYNLWMDT